MAYIVKEAKKDEVGEYDPEEAFCGSGRDGIRKLSGTSGLNDVRSHCR